MCENCGRSLFVPGVSRRRPPAKVPQKKPPLLSLLLACGGEVSAFLHPLEVLGLLEVARTFYVALTSGDGVQVDFWKRVVLATHVTRRPSVFPADKGPVTDDDISQLMPGIECPEENCWLLYHRIATRKCHWLEKVQENCTAMQQRFESLVPAPVLSEAAFARNPVYFLVLREGQQDHDLTFENVEHLVRGSFASGVSTRVLRDSVLLVTMPQCSHPQVAAWYLLEPFTPSDGDGGQTAAAKLVTRGDVEIALSDFLSSQLSLSLSLSTPQCEPWACEAFVPPCYEMPLEVYIIRTR